MKARFFIISISYWANDEWVIEPGTESTRKEAEQRIKALRDADFDKHITVSRKYRIMTMTEIKKTFGAHWYTRVINRG